MQGGYSMNLSAINNFVKNTHFLAKLRAAMKKKLKIQTSSQNKERMLSGKRLCELTIVLMAQQLERYLNPFDKEPARNFKTEEVIEENINSSVEFQYSQRKSSSRIHYQAPSAVRGKGDFFSSIKRI